MASKLEELQLRVDKLQSQATMHYLLSVCSQLGAASARGIVVPKDYYSRSLEERRALLGAYSIHHLCKTLVLENFVLPPNSSLPRYYAVVVQYTAKFNAEKMAKFVKEASSDSGLGKQFFKFRLVDPEISFKLTGYSHNSVVPLALPTPLPILLDEKIAKLSPRCFWMGGGEVDVKIGMTVDDMCCKIGAKIADISYDEVSLGAELED